MNEHAKHTPGPWRLAQRSYGGPDIIRDDEDGHAEVVATVGPCLADADQLGNLFLAAPELLAALKGLVEELDSANSGYTLKEARAAIAKAEGQG